MRLAIIIFILSFLISCDQDNYSKKQITEENNEVLKTNDILKKDEFSIQQFYLKTVFYPAFLDYLEIEIKVANDSNFLKLKIFEIYSTDSLIELSSEIKPINKHALLLFQDRISKYNLLKLTNGEGYGFDGVSVFFSYSNLLNDTNEFHFWSPSKHDIEHELVEITLEFVNEHFTSPVYQNYFESLEQYFDFGLPIKIIQDNPLKIRMYGSISINEKDELLAFINTLPTDKPFEIDISNFGGMAKMFYPLFEELILKNKQISWLYKTDGQNEFLKKIGVETKNIRKLNNSG